MVDRLTPVEVLTVLKVNWCKNRDMYTLMCLSSLADFEWSVVQIRVCALKFGGTHSSVAERSIAEPMWKGFIPFFVLLGECKAGTQPHGHCLHSQIRVSEVFFLGLQEGVQFAR
jgi:hypothetical protein